jgi:hypothetical protein
MQEHGSVGQDWRRPFWLALLIASSIAFGFALACATPFAAFAAALALTLPRRDAVYGIVGVWLANQAVGFAFLHYPLDLNCLAWGAALGVTAILCTLVAHQIVLRMRTSRLLSGTTAFLAAFATYEVMLFLGALVLGGEDALTFAIQTQAFAINVVGMAGLLLLHWLGETLRIAPTSAQPAHA